MLFSAIVIAFPVFSAIFFSDNWVKDADPLICSGNFHWTKLIQLVYFPSVFIFFYKKNSNLYRF